YWLCRRKPKKEKKKKRGYMCISYKIINKLL
ncbi:MAG: hypothetical protein ACI8RH_000555, partial [Flavobacteriales bacterium]